MGTATINGDLWGARADAWSDVQEGQCRPLYDAALASLAAGPGASLLDAGTVRMAVNGRDVAMASGADTRVAVSLSGGINKVTPRAK